ncbi:MAG TPA: DUF2231 domain-containing protein [Gemmatimonadales bacterium]|jgi:uncharacterized membrane protein
MLGYDWARLHAALNDLPTALLLTAVLFDVGALATRRESLRLVGFWTMVIGAIGGAAAVISGLQAQEHIEHGEEVHRVMETHEELALITLGIFAVLALWRIFREKRMGSRERSFVLILSLGGVGILFATAVYGGKLVFEHAAAIPSAVLQEELHERAEGHHHHDGELATPAAPQDSSAGQGPSTDHVDPPGAPPQVHSHPPGTPPHRD